MLDYQSPSGRFILFRRLAPSENTIAAAWTISRPTSSTCAANRNAVRRDKTIGATWTPSFRSCAVIFCRANDDEGWQVVGRVKEGPGQIFEADARRR